VLILHGAEDTNVPLGQSVYFHRALRHFGVEHEFVIYPREGHSIRERHHQLDVLPPDPCVVRPLARALTAARSSSALAPAHFRALWRRWTFSDALTEWITLWGLCVRLGGFSRRSRDQPLSVRAKGYDVVQSNDDGNSTQPTAGADAPQDSYVAGTGATRRMRRRTPC
jgi:hypothetical protein